MPHSYSQQADLTCSSCNRTFTVEVWLIVDTVERLDLVERIRQRSLHTFSCPHCQQEGEVDAPLLLYYPSQEPPLFFSPAQGTNSAQDQQQAIGLIELLQERLGNTWREDWLAAGLVSISRPYLLPATLSDDLEAALRQMAEQAQQTLEDLQQQAPETYNQLETSVQQVQQVEPLLQILDQFIRAETWHISQQIVDQQPELLTDEADALLSQALKLAHQKGDDNSIRILEEHWHLLHRCREIGVASAFAEKLGFSSPEQAGANLMVPPEFSNDLLQATHAVQRYQASGDRVALDTAIDAWERILNHPTFTRAPERFQLAVLNDAGKIFLQRYSARGLADDLNSALRLLQQAVTNSPADYPDRPSYLNNLGNGLRDRYRRTGQLEDLEEAIRVYRQAVATVPSDHPNRSVYLNNLGTGLRIRYDRTDHLKDIEETIQMFQQAVVSTPPNHSDRPMFLNNLGNSLSVRYSRTDRLEDLEEAIQMFQQAVATSPSGHPNRASRLNNLGNGLRALYSRTGRLEDLEEAISMYEQAVTASPPDHSERPGYLTNLGTGLRDRYRRTGRLEDLSKAIQVYQQAVAASPLTHTDRPMYLSNLGNGLRERHSQTGRQEDLDEAIRVFQQAVDSTPLDHPVRAVYLTNLGTGLNDRYDRIGRQEDLDEAIQVYQQAVELNSLEHSDRPSYLNNLGTGLRDRYRRTGRQEDLAETIQRFQQAVDVTPPDDPDRPMYLDNLGESLSERYSRTGRLEDLNRAIQVYEEALAFLDRTFLFSTVAYQLGQQDRWAGLFIRVVKLYQQAGRSSQALAVVEGSKSRLLTTLLSRGDLPVPPAIPAHLVAQEESTATQLTALDAVELASQGQPATTQTETERLARLEQRRHLVDQLASLWQEMAGYGQEAANYVGLRRGDWPDWEELQHLAGQLGPQVAILSLFSLPEQVLLFVLRADQQEPRLIDIPLFGDELRYNYLVNYEDEMLSRRSHRVARRPLTHRWRELGLRLLAPALPYLEDVSHLVIAPHGLFHYLPLHALVLNETRETLVDHFAISYVPALGLLARLLNRPPLETGEAFVLGYTPANPATQEGAIEREIFLGEAIAVANQMNVHPCLDEQAHSDQLKAALAGQTLSLVHLSCHGGFDQTDPLQSGVLLADGMFTARQWMELRFRADLVTLSACQTALTKSLGGDELAGLSQALLYAGTSSLLLGLWSVNAFTTQALMTDFYRRLWDGSGHKRSDEVTALREATLALRDGQLLLPVDGFDPADPYYWAPFILIGDWR